MFEYLDPQLERLVTTETNNDELKEALKILAITGIEPNYLAQSEKFKEWFGDLTPQALCFYEQFYQQYSIQFKEHKTVKDGDVIYLTPPAQYRL